MSVFSRNHGSLTCLFDPTLSYLHTAPLWHNKMFDKGNRKWFSCCKLFYNICLTTSCVWYCDFFNFSKNNCVYCVCMELFDSLQGTPSILNMLEIFDHVTYQILSQVVHGWDLSWGAAIFSSQRVLFLLDVCVWIFHFRSREEITEIGEARWETEDETRHFQFLYAEGIPRSWPLKFRKLRTSFYAPRDLLRKISKLERIFKKKIRVFLSFTVFIP